MKGIGVNKKEQRKLLTQLLVDYVLRDYGLTTGVATTYRFGGAISNKWSVRFSENEWLLVELQANCAVLEIVLKIGTSVHTVKSMPTAGLTIMSLTRALNEVVYGYFDPSPM